MQLPRGEKATSVAVGENHTAILTASGKILMCGSDAAMQLGAARRRDGARFHPCSAR
jgi:alpha-tubulin suppressor-like RCC1 family protein